MTPRQARGGVTLSNVVEMGDKEPELLLELIQDLIDNPAHDLPDEALTRSNIEATIAGQAYYGNLHPFLIGLWGALRFSADRGNPHRIAVRDYLKEAASSCKVKYEGASRILTGYQELMKEKGPRTI